MEDDREVSENNPNVSIYLLPVLGRYVGGWVVTQSFDSYGIEEV